MKLSKSQIKKLDKLSKKKPIMVRVGHNWYNWYESEGNIVWLTTQSGDEKEFKYKEIDDIQEVITKIIKTQLREIIKEEIQKLNEMDSKKAIVSLKGDYPGSKVYQAHGDGKTSVKTQQTNKTWDDGAPMTNKFGPKKTSKVPRGKFWVLDTKKFWYYELKGVWNAIKKSEYGTPPGFEY